MEINIESVYSGLIDPDDIMRIVGKRTVYSRYEIEEMVEKGAVTVILFRHHFHLNNPLSFDELKNMGVLRGPPQSIMKISNENYNKVKEAGGIDERYTVN